MLRCMGDCPLFRSRGVICAVLMQIAISLDEGNSVQSYFQPCGMHFEKSIPTNPPTSALRQDDPIVAPRIVPVAVQAT